MYLSLFFEMLENDSQATVLGRNYQNEIEEDFREDTN